MNDELLISLHLDGRLPPDEAPAFEARLAAEPALREELEGMRRLQSLSASLATTSADFSADDIRVRARTSRGGWWRLAAAAAAVLLLALTHGGAFFLGVEQQKAAQTPSTDDAEAFLRRARELDFSAPLEDQLADLREELDPQLISMSGGDYADRLGQLEVAFDAQHDPLMLAVTVRGIASGEMRMVPATANSYLRVTPVGEGRFRLVFIRGNDRVVDEGTLPELERRNPTFQFVEEK